MQKSCYERKKAQAHLIKGAIAATRAASRKERQESDREDNSIALVEFRGATGVQPEKLQAFEDGDDLDAFERADVQALEYVGHIHFRLGNPTLALLYFRKCAALTKTMGAADAALPLVRALRHQAEILEWQNTPSSLDQARARLTEAIAALPSDRRDGIDGAELYEMRARVQKKRYGMRQITAREPRRDYAQAEQRYALIATSQAEAARNRVTKEKDELPPDAPAEEEAGPNPS